MKPKLHFAHGNGFPSPCYRQMLEPLEVVFDCCYIDKIGHAEAFPIEDNWHFLVDELLESVRMQSDEPVVAVGHSLGGVLSILGALKEPELFRAVILLDSPLLSRVRARAVQLSKKFGFIDRVTPASRTRTRRTHWKNRDAVFQYFKRRALFKQFDDACLNDYIDYGMTHDETGYTLRFDAAIEYQIYRTLPHTFARYTKKLQVPTALLYGSNSDVIYAADRRHMQRRYGIQSFETSGTHMFPLEYPKETAALILKVLAALK
ncbi:MAG: alpha/beta hydrolase [Gammaproteobacteria bacterium]|nr:alpha/beta hydrolase [Gammaproteobacteria bacterium]